MSILNLFSFIGLFYTIVSAENNIYLQNGVNGVDELDFKFTTGQVPDVMDFWNDYFGAPLPTLTNDGADFVFDQDENAQRYLNSSFPVLHGTTIFDFEYFNNYAQLMVRMECPDFDQQHIWNFVVVPQFTVVKGGVTFSGAIADPETGFLTALDIPSTAMSLPYGFSALQVQTIQTSNSLEFVVNGQSIYKNTANFYECSSGDPHLTLIAGLPNFWSYNCTEVDPDNKICVNGQLPNNSAPVILKRIRVKDSIIPFCYMGDSEDSMKFYHGEATSSCTLPTTTSSSTSTITTVTPTSSSKNTSTTSTAIQTSSSSSTSSSTTIIPTPSSNSSTTFSTITPTSSFNSTSSSISISPTPLSNSTSLSTTIWPSTVPFSTDTTTWPTIRPSTEPLTESTSGPFMKPSTLSTAGISTESKTSPKAEPSNGRSVRCSIGCSTETSSFTTNGPSSFTTNGPSSSPKIEPNTDPSTESITWPTTGPTSEPSAKPSTEPPTGPSSSPTTVPTTEPTDSTITIKPTATSTSTVPTIDSFGVGTSMIADTASLGLGLLAAWILALV
ncbi:hypothetical protein DASC09_033260 [Saccharomycopsis crataegensis]|uniref:Uncharacterized protein n=1 Tax=Saccharomycopsis crataegensis TaxID=43959 RepID=A0AAV5QN38_9ASCO|nr:hypothetical protein DASC09_033260 [Saccharomycopsis crataegensis]